MALMSLLAMGAGSFEDPLPAAPPGDPADAPLADPPLGQPPPTSRRWEPDYTSGYTDRRRAQFTVLPAYALVGLDFLGRPNKPFHGAGVMGDLEVQLWKWLWLRLGGSVTAHPFRERVRRNDDDEVVDVAPAGALTVAGGNLGLAYALDFGRILALLDASGGAVFLAQPTGVQDGQRGRTCRSGRVCDPGLGCAPDNVCRNTTVPTLSAGLSVEWLVRDHLSLGATIRYYALLAEPSVYPIYLQLAARIGVRF